MPGLPGKGVVDLQITSPPQAVPLITEALLGLGFQRQTGRAPHPPTRPMLRGTLRYDGTVFAIQCHIVPEGHPECRAMLEFRDLLRQSARLRDAYAALKQRIVEAGTTDPIDYTELKTQFVEAALRARA